MFSEIVIKSNLFGCILRIRQHRFFCGNNSSDWLVKNLVKNGVILGPWTVLFAAVLDRIWSNHNEFVFSNGNHSIERIIHQSE